MTKVYEELGQKEMIVSKYVERERELMDRIDELESEIDAKVEEDKANKLKYEKIVKESMINAKHKVIDSLPGMMQASKHKVQIIGPWSYLSSLQCPLSPANKLIPLVFPDAAPLHLVLPPPTFPYKQVCPHDLLALLSRLALSGCPCPAIILALNWVESAWGRNNEWDVFW